MINSDIQFDLVKKELWDAYETAGKIIEEAMKVRAQCRALLKEIDWEDYFKRQESEEVE